MKRIFAVLLTAALLAACAQEPSPASVAGSATPVAATPAPTPVPAPEVPEYEARLRALQQEIENLLPGRAFEDMSVEELAQYTEPFGGDFQGIGRVWGEQAYVLLEPVEPPPEGLCYNSNGEVYYPGEDRPAIEIGLFSLEAGFEGPVAYTVSNVDGAAFQQYTSQVALWVNGDLALASALSFHTRALWHLAHSRGLLPSWERPEGAALLVRAFDMDLYYTLGFMSAAEYYIPLTQEEQALLQRANSARTEAGRGSEAFATGLFIEMDKSHTGWQMLGDGHFVESFLHEKSVIYESPEMAEFVRAKIIEVFGYDPYSFSMEDFSKIVRAEFTYPTAIHASREEFTTHTLEEAEDLSRLGEILSSGQHIGRGGSGCSFHSELLLTLEDGRTITVNIATDSCRTSLIDGRIALDDYDKASLFRLFGIEEMW